jgi:hypothetical protein
MADANKELLDFILAGGKAKATATSTEAKATGQSKAKASAKGKAKAKAATLKIKKPAAADSKQGKEGKAGTNSKEHTKGNKKALHKGEQTEDRTHTRATAKVFKRPAGRSEEALKEEAGTTEESSRDRVKSRMFHLALATGELDEKTVGVWQKLQEGTGKRAKQTDFINAIISRQDGKLMVKPDSHTFQQYLSSSNTQYYDQR